MKVCLATARHEFRMSGEMESILNLQQYLRCRGVESDVLTPQGYYLPRMEMSETGLSWSKFLDFRRLFLRLKEVGGRYDLVHVFLPFPALSWYADLLRLALHLKLVVTFESCAVGMSGLDMKGFRGREALSNLIRLFVNNLFWARCSTCSAEAYIVSSNYQKEQLGRPEVKVIPNLTDSGRFVRVERGKARQMFGIPSGVFALAYVGHLLEFKGISDLLKAFSRIVRKEKQIRLIIAASGIGSVERMQRFAEAMEVADHTDFMGEVDVPALLSAADLLVAPYRVPYGTNWIPSIILEASLVGVPVLTSNLPPLRELEEQGMHLSFAKAGDPEDLASEILRIVRGGLITDNERVLSPVRPEAFILDADNIISQYLAVYRKVVNEKD